MDDASTDHTGDVVRGLGDPRIRYLRHESNRGGSAARNTGIRAARGEYLAFLDSDDEWLPDKLERQLQLLRSVPADNDIGAVVSGVVYVEAQGQHEVRTERSDNKSFDDILAFRDWRLTTSSFLVRRVVTDHGARFDETFPCFQDWDFILGIARRWRIGAVPEPLVRQYRDHGGEHVWTRSNALRGRLRILDKYQKELQQRPRLLAQLHRTISRDYYRSGDIERARAHLRKALGARPTDLWLRWWVLALRVGDLPFRASAWVCYRVTRHCVTLGLLRKTVTPFR